MNSYFVTWSIEVDAESPEEAAKLARKYQEPGTTATCFEVTNEDGETVSVDLLEVETDG